jgi:hypothetical protein
MFSLIASSKPLMLYMILKGGRRLLIVGQRGELLMPAAIL